MTLDDIRFVFNRALILSCSLTKLLLSFAVLVLCGIFVIFFHGFSFDVNQWLSLSLTFIPIFICGGLLLSSGVLLIRIYHDEIKRKEIDLQKIVRHSWNVLLSATYFSVPLFLAYLVLWLFLGAFVLFSHVPGLGILFNTVLVFGPFLLHLATLCLILLNIALLFYVAPILALKGEGRLQVLQILAERFIQDPFSNLLLLFVGAIPLLFVLLTLLGAVFLTGSLCYHCEGWVHVSLFWFFLMVPFTALLSPAVVFFFNFAAESHVLMMKKVLRPR